MLCTRCSVGSRPYPSADMAYDSKISRFPYYQCPYTHPLRSSKKSKLHCVTTSRLCQPTRLGFIPNYPKVTYLFIYVIFALTVTNVPYAHPTPPRFIYKANNKTLSLFAEAKLFITNKKMEDYSLREFH